MISVETGKWLIEVNGYGHSNVKSFDQFTDEQLSELGLTRDPSVMLDAGKFQVPQTQEFETAMNRELDAAPVDPNMPFRREQIALASSV